MKLPASKHQVARGLVVMFLLVAGNNVHADRITLRIATGHPPGVVYAGLMQTYFQTELARRVEERTEHTINFIEGYSGSIVRTSETLEGVQNGIVDIGGFCYCFEPSNLPLHAFQVMLPFGTMDPTVSLKIAQDVYREVPYLTEVFEEEFNQKLLARIADAGYNLGTSFDWNTVEDLQGIKIAGAGLNLNWLRHAGATPVQGALPEAYTGLRTNVYEGWIMFSQRLGAAQAVRTGPLLHHDRLRLHHLARSDHQSQHLEPSPRRRTGNPPGGGGRLRGADRFKQP